MIYANIAIIARVTLQLDNVTYMCVWCYRNQVSLCVCVLQKPGTVCVCVMCFDLSFDL